MNAIILYDALTSGGSTDRIINAIGEELVKKGVYVEKVKTPPRADYGFLNEFDLVIIASPVYNFNLSPNLVAAFSQSNLSDNLKGKKIATFLVCGGPELTANFLYMPQLTMRLLGQNVVAQKIFGLTEKNNPQSPILFAEEIYRKAVVEQSA